jgi:hypothetical protein
VWGSPLHETPPPVENAPGVGGREATASALPTIGPEG